MDNQKNIITQVSDNQVRGILISDRDKKQWIKKNRNSK